MGFPEGWIRIIMRCVFSVSYSVLVNGTPYGNFTPLRGLWQGLSSLIARVELEGKLSGVPILAEGYRLTHLFFANDRILFCRTTFSEWGKSSSDLINLRSRLGTET